MNYAIGVTDNVNVNLNAQYTMMTRLSSSGSITGNQTLNNSFQCGAGMSYSF